MELVSIQALLARLYTDQAFREQFLNAPELTARPYQIGKNDLEKLIQLANGPALQFSRTLIRKRFGQVAAFLPATRRVLGAQMWEAFLSFAGNYNPKGVGRHLFDAIEFSVFLTKVFKNRINAPDWWPLITKYERTGLKAEAAPFYFNVKIFKSDILRLYKSSENETAEYTGPPHLVVWCKLTPASKVWHQHFFPKYWPGRNLM